MSAVKMIAAFSENKPGEAARITKLVADSGANIRWVTIASNGSFGVVKLLVDKCEEAMAALRQKNVAVNFVEVLAIEVKDRCGALNTVLEFLAKNDINVENTSGFVANNRAVLVLEVEDTSATRSLLKRHGLQVLTQEEIFSL